MSTTNTEPRTPENQQVRWEKLCKFLEKWFESPDLEGLRICLSTYVAHFYRSSPPVWLFIMGPSGAGKSSVAIKSISFLPKTFMLDDIGVNSFASGFGKGDNGFLAQLDKKHNSNGILLFSDFTTTLLSKRHEVRDELAGQLRAIYDGTFAKKRGNMAESLPWGGKLTILAGTTPALETYWSVNRSLGERFLYLRWKTGDPVATAKKATTHIGHEQYIKDEFRRLVNDYVGEGFKAVPRLSDLGLSQISHVVSVLRTVVHREARTGQITEIDATEAPTRIATALGMIARGSATLDRRPEISSDDIVLAHRVAIDSLPNHRYKIMYALFQDLHCELPIEKLRAVTRIPRSSFDRTIDDLDHLEVITRTADDHFGEIISVTPRMRQYWEESTVDHFLQDFYEANKRFEKEE